MSSKKNYEEGYFLNLVYAHSNLLNAYLGGHRDQSFSGRSYEYAVTHKSTLWKVVRKIIDTIFFWEKGNHTKDAYFYDIEDRSYLKKILEEKGKE